jgi:hypothetical protein
VKLNGAALPLVRAGVKLNDVVLSLPLALGRGWLIRIVFDALIMAAAETGHALFETVESAILDFVSQIYPGAPRIILTFGG